MESEAGYGHIILQARWWSASSPAKGISQPVDSFGRPKGIVLYQLFILHIICFLEHHALPGQLC